MDVDVAIVGAGPVGASLAAALAGSRLTLALLEQGPPPVPGPDWDARIYALSPASVAFLDGVGAWQRLDASRVNPVGAMRIFGDDGRSRLEFSAYEAGVIELAATVESGRLQSALWPGLARQRNLELLCPAAPTRLRRRRGAIEILLENGEAISARLVVGADGANSWVRRAAGIEVEGRAYAHDGVVANFACERAHRNIAYQWFREDGVLAWLPLPQKRMSIVWSTPAANARELLALPPQALCARVAGAGERTLGRLELETPAAAFPLSRSTARPMVQPRIALIGDAAHVVHPLAGQGVNLGLADAHALAGALCAAPAGDVGDLSVLRRFERARAEDILAFRWITEGLFHLFGARHPLLARARNFGLNFTDALPILKTLLARRAMGIGGGHHHREFA